MFGVYISFSSRFSCEMATVMTCCGKIQAVVNIAHGWLAVWLDEQFKLPALSYEFHAARHATCLKCTEQTWMTRDQYIAWLTANAADVAKSIEDLSVLPPLPKQEQGPKTKLFCRQCKCWLPAKTRVAGAKCPMGRW